MENRIPGHALPIDNNNQIEVTSWCVTDAVLSLRVLTVLPDGQLQQHVFTHSTLNTGLPKTERFRIDSGVLIGASIMSVTTDLRAWMLFAQVKLVRGDDAAWFARLTDFRIREPEAPVP